MKGQFRWVLVVLLMLAVVVPLSAAGKQETGAAAKPRGEITILWAESQSARWLQELCDLYTEQTGVKVTVEMTPWSDFQTKAFTELAARGDAYDMIIGDSQWLGRGATQGHFVELTQWMKERGVDKSMAAATVGGYSEYPKGSGRYWAIPAQGSASAWMYRKDVFEDPKEKQAFKSKYGYELAVPQSWAQLKDIAEFFYRPAENFYGVSIWTVKEYDGITMGFQNVLWAFGADLGNYETNRIQGVLNTPEGIEALEFYKELYELCPPDWGAAHYTEANQAITQNLVPMSMNFTSFFPAMVNPEMNKYAQVTGFFANPAGPGGRYASMGGQGISLISYSKKQDLCLEFLEWFVKGDVQWKWARLGGYSCSADVLESPEFDQLKPYNETFKESMMIVKDFWAVPEYAELLEIMQRYLHGYLVADQYTAAEALDNIATEWEAVFERAGYYKK
jgi:multiple sugar transport system substrate-binding protein